MIYQASLIISALEKFNNLINIPLILNNEIDTGKKSIQNIEITTNEFQKIINSINRSQVEQNGIDKNSLKQLSACLEVIIKNLNIIKKIMHIAAKRHLDYTDALEAKKNYHA